MATDTATTIFSNYHTAVIDTVWTPPSLTFGSQSATATGAIQPYTYNCGHASGTKLYIYASPFDTLLSHPSLIDSVPLSGSGSATYLLHGFPSAIYVSYQGWITSPIGTRTSAIKWVLTGVAAAPDSAKIDTPVATATTTSVAVNYAIKTGGIPTTFKGYIGNTAGAVIQATSGYTFTHDTLLHVVYSGLTSSTNYLVWGVDSNASV